MSDDNWGPSMFRGGGFSTGSGRGKKIIGYTISARPKWIGASKTRKTTSKEIKALSVEKIIELHKKELEIAVAKQCKNGGLDYHVKWITED